MINHVGYLNLAYLGLWLIPIVLINYRFGIGINKSLIISVLRMTIQLSLVGIYLQYLFDLNNGWLNIAYILAMMIVASISILRATKLRLSKLLGPMFLALMIPNIGMLLFFNYFVTGIDNILDARYIITIGGMILGNALNGNIIGVDAYYTRIRDNIEVVNYELSLGATRFEATKPFWIEAVKACVKPTIASMATIGLVSLPGMMTGQILGGSIPREAIMYQIAIMIAIFITKYFNIMLAIRLTQRSMFNKKDQLISAYFVDQAK